MTFLLADDSRTARNILKSFLNEIRIPSSPPVYLEASSGEEALSLVQNERVDLVFLDWNMSTVMTGLDVLIEIRKIGRLKELPIIMVTSEIEKTNVIASLKMGANDYLVKPVEEKTFRKKVNRILKLE